VPLGGAGFESQVDLTEPAPITPFAHTAPKSPCNETVMPTVNPFAALAAIPCRELPLISAGETIAE
jgi:hypothetical protein